jgi:hypothetical protein
VKLRWKILLGSLVLLGCLVLWLVVTHYRARNAVAAYQKRLVAQGEKLKLGELTPRISDPRLNGAPALMAAAVKVSVNLSNFLPIATVMSSGGARVSWQQATLPTDELTNIWPKVSEDVTNSQAAVAGMRLALEKPILFFPLNYELGFNILLPHLAKIKFIELCLSFAALEELHQGDPDTAWENLQAGGRLVRSFGEHEPLQISQLVRIAMGHIAINTAWEALQYPGWNDRQLTELQQVWDSFSFMDALEPTLGMERFLSQDVLLQIRDSSTNLSSFSGSGSSPNTLVDELADMGKSLAENPAEGFKTILDGYPRYWAWKGWWSYDEELSRLQIYQAELDLVRSARKTQAWAVSAKNLEMTVFTIGQSFPHADHRFLLSGIDSDIPKYLLKMADAEAARRLLVTAIALRRYQLQKSAYPGELKDLVPNYLAAFPIDPMDGQPLRYRPNPDGTFLLYSVGEDGEDNGGDRSEKAREAAPGTVPRHLAWYKKRDAVWPAPAGTDEVKAYQDLVLEIQMRRKTNSPEQQFRERYGVPHPMAVPAPAPSANVQVKTN